MAIVYSKEITVVQKLGRSLAKAVEEHGYPNSFGFAELVGHKDAMFAGKAVRKHWGAFCLNVGSRAHVRVNLLGSRIYVTEDS